MAKLVIQSGKKKLNLRKSDTLIGLKSNNPTVLEERQVIEKKVFENMGGFQIVSLPNDDLDSKLDEMRKWDEVDVGTHVYLPEGSEKPLVPTGEILLVFAAETSPEEQAIVLEEFYLEEVERRDEYTIIARVTAKSPNPLKVASFLEHISLVQYAEPDFDTELDEYEVQLPSDSLFSHQWHLRNLGKIVDSNHFTKRGADARIIDAWNRLGNMGSSNIVVAVIDNGFDLTHPDLQSKVYRPIDLWSNSTNVLQGDSRYTHGTPCASLALASSNGAGMVGVAPNARFMPVSGTSFSLRATEQMFDYCIRNGADVISCSWGTTDPNFMLNDLKKEAISRAIRQGRNGKGCVVVFAVGNDNKDFVSYYAAHPDVIAVAACTSKDEHAPYSNRGREVTVCAPSNGDWPLIAARAWWDPGASDRGAGDYRYWADGRPRGGDKYKHFGGTSASCPIVAGICALMLSANPDLTAREVKEILIQTADKIGPSWEYSNGHSSRYGHGRVNADRAVAEAIRRRTGSSATTPTPVSVPPVTTPTTTAPATKPKGWGVQIGVFSDYNNVLAQVDRMKKLFGVPVSIVPTTSGGRTVYRVIVGTYESPSGAQAMAQQMKSSGVDGFVKDLSQTG